jgi:hypothetical protein
LYLYWGLWMTFPSSYKSPNNTTPTRSTKKIIHHNSQQP